MSGFSVCKTFQKPKSVEVYCWDPSSFKVTKLRVFPGLFLGSKIVDLLLFIAVFYGHLLPSFIFSVAAFWNSAN